jgi:hypothetical protein
MGQPVIQGPPAVREDTFEPVTPKRAPGVVAAVIRGGKTDHAISAKQRLENRLIPFNKESFISSFFACMQIDETLGLVLFHVKR